MDGFAEGEFAEAGDGETNEEQDTSTSQNGDGNTEYTAVEPDAESTETQVKGEDDVIGAGPTETPVKDEEEGFDRFRAKTNPYGVLCGLLFAIKYSRVPSSFTQHVIYQCVYCTRVLSSITYSQYERLE